MHGGLSPDLNSMEQIRRVMRPTDVSCAMWFVSLFIIFRLELQEACRALWSSRLLNTLTNVDSWLWASLRPSLVRSRQRYHRLEWEWSRCVVYIRPRCRIAFPPKTWHGFDMPCSSSCWGWVRILLQATTCDPFQCTQLLRWIRQRRRNDECWWEFTLFVPGMRLLEVLSMGYWVVWLTLIFFSCYKDFETSRKETKVRLRGHELRQQAQHSSAKTKEIRNHTSFSMYSRFGRR